MPAHRLGTSAPAMSRPLTAPRWRCLIGALPVLLLFSNLATADRVLLSDGDLKAMVPDGDTWCRSEAAVVLQSADSAAFRDEERLTRLVGGLRAALSFECPQATSIRMVGTVAERIVFDATATQADNWQLVYRPDSLQPGLAAAPTPPAPNGTPAVASVPGQPALPPATESHAPAVAIAEPKQAPARPAAPAARQHRRQANFGIGTLAMFSTPIGYKLIASDLTAALQRTSEQPVVQRESEYYLETIKNIKSIDEFISNDRVFKYAMKAFGLEDMNYAKAFMRKVLTEGIDDPQSFANKLSDPKYREFAETFNFARYTSGATVFERARQGTVDRYLRQTLEIDAGRSNEGVRLALYFQRKAASVETPFHLMADRALLRVTQIALGIPEATATMDIDRQAEMIAKKLDIEDLKDPEKLDKFIGRFTALWEVENPTMPATSGITQLFNGYDSGISYDLLTQMQNIRKV